MEIFDYDNILLLPRKCRVQSRAECDTSVEFGPRRFKLPVVPANMKTVLDEAIAEQLARSDHFYVIRQTETMFEITRRDAAMQETSLSF